VSYLGLKRACQQQGMHMTVSWFDLTTSCPGKETNGKCTTDTDSPSKHTSHNKPHHRAHNQQKFSSSQFWFSYSD